MGAYTKQLQRRTSDIATKQDIVTALERIFVPLAKEVDDLKARVAALEAEQE